MDGPPVRPAATVLALRDGPSGPEVLMVRRNLKSDFVGGAYVFPGGALDPADASAAMAARCRGTDDARASASLGLAEGGLAYLVAAARELFEEAGLLLAVDDDGAAVALDDEARWAANRAARNEGAESFADLLAREGLCLDLGGVAYLAHWVTPEGPPRRFDTRFFCVAAPPGQQGAPDAGETVASVWIRPTDALAGASRGDFEMIFPTIRTLESIAGATGVGEVLAFARDQGPVERRQPRIVERDGRVAILLPGDDGYAD